MPGFPPVSYIKPVHSQVQPYDLLLLQTGLCFPAMQTQSHAVLFQCFFFFFLAVLGIEPRALRMLSMCTDLILSRLHCINLLLYSYIIQYTETL